MSNLCPPPCAGVVSRTFGIMPEKAFKMQGWIIVGRYMESHFEQPTISKWLVAGAAAGAATTIIGELARLLSLSLPLTLTALYLSLWHTNSLC